MIRLERDGALALITLDAPERRNALDLEDWGRLGEIAGELDADEALRCVVVTGRGDHFAAGADISEFPEKRSSAEQAAAYGRVVQEALEALANLRHPTIAMIRGACTGGGLEIACVCDIRIASDEARFGFPINKLGHALAYPEMAAALSVIPASVLLDLLLDPRIIQADEALGRGVISRLARLEDLEDETEDAVKRVSSGAPLANRYNKSLLRRLARGESLNQKQVHETYGLCDSADYAAGVDAFLNKKKVTFEGK